MRNRVRSTRSSQGETLGLTSFDLVLTGNQVPKTPVPIPRSRVTRGYRVTGLTHHLHSPGTKLRKCTCTANSPCSISSSTTLQDTGRSPYSGSKRWCIRWVVPQEGVRRVMF